MASRQQWKDGGLNARAVSVPVVVEADRLNMRAARLMLGFGQNDLAVKANVGRQTVLRLERGDTSITNRIWDKVFDALAEAGIEFVPPTTDRSWGIRLRMDDGDEG
jgi:transcriptional regulator with XRE-family HTH domain